MYIYINVYIIASKSERTRSFGDIGASEPDDPFLLLLAHT